LFLFFFFNDTATTEIYTLSLHDALPISIRAWANARIECVGGANPAIDEGDEACLERIVWRGHRVRVPRLDVQLEVSRRRGLDDRVRLIEELLA